MLLFRAAVLAKINVADTQRGATAEDAAITAKSLSKAGADMLVLEVDALSNHLVHVW